MTKAEHINTPDSKWNQIPMHDQVIVLTPPQVADLVNRAEARGREIGKAKAEAKSVEPAPTSESEPVEAPYTPISRLSRKSKKN